MKDLPSVRFGLAAFAGILGGLAVSGLLLSGLGVLGAGIGGGVTTSAAVPTLYTIEITHNGSACQVNTTWKGKWGFSHSSSNNWVTISETNNDTVAWVHTGGADTSYTVNFPPVRSAAFPDTPFLNYTTGAWVNQFTSSPQPVSSTVATLTPAESNAALTRFFYDSVIFNNKNKDQCNFPIQGMGIQITK